VRCRDLGVLVADGVLNAASEVSRRRRQQADRYRRGTPGGLRCCWDAGKSVSRRHLALLRPCAAGGSGCGALACSVHGGPSTYGRPKIHLRTPEDADVRESAVDPVPPACAWQNLLGVSRSVLGRQLLGASTAVAKGCRRQPWCHGYGSLSSDGPLDRSVERAWRWCRRSRCGAR
jgi:hypothetical protein